MSGFSLDYEDVDPFIPMTLCLGKPYGSFLSLSFRVREMGLGYWEVVKVKTLREGSFIYGTPKVVGPGVEGWMENPMSAH